MSEGGLLMDHHTTVRRALQLLLPVALLASSGCGTDAAGDGAAGDGVSTASGCDVPPQDIDPVTVAVQWSGPWDEVAAPSLLEQWDEATPQVEVEVATATAAATPALLTGPVPPTVARVPASAVALLAAAGAIQPLERCFDEGEPAVGDMVDGAAALGTVDGTRYGITGNVGTAVLVYDRAAFAAAGLDPDEPPTTWEEVRSDAEVIRAATGMESPVAGFAPSLTLVDSELGDELPTALAVWVDMAREGLLHTDDGSSGMPPLGAGRAAMQVTQEGQLWGYGSALAQGQAPDADLAVAPLPGTTRAGTPVLGEVWVVSSDASDEEAAAAMSFLRWLHEDEQQARLHPLTDLFPATPSAGRHPAALAYLDSVPLLGDAWEVITGSATATPVWAQVPGAVAAVDALGEEAAAGGRDAAEAWPEVADAIRSASAHFDRDPLPLLGCVFPEHAPAAPLTACWRDGAAVPAGEPG